MNLVRCEKGHFYDQDKNGTHCPYCAQLSAASTPQPELENTKTTVQEISSSSSASPALETLVNASCETTASIQNTDSSILTDTEEDNCTVGYYSRVIGVEPVIGWLVCIEGEYRGESFKLKSGRNFIGRAANMDVVLSADHSISRFKHASVIYEPRSRQFIVSAGESRELCYLNGEVVLSNIKMEAYDILNLGNTSLMLVPCCGKHFSWEEGLTKEEEKNEK